MVPITGSLAPAQWSFDSPQVPPFAIVDLTSTVTAGNVPMVTVKMKHTDRAITQIWRAQDEHNQDEVTMLISFVWEEGGGHQSEAGFYPSGDSE